jgi:heterotetrameric sarcosine oxidase delta subunit
MLQIVCPWCGLRDEDDYRFGGESHVSRPSLQADARQWSDYLFNRSNPEGVQYERWLHANGCGRWFNLARDTLTHEVLAVYRMGEPKPVLEAGEDGDAADGGMRG